MENIGLRAFMSIVSLLLLNGVSVWLSTLWFHQIHIWSGGMPYIITVCAWFFLGGVELAFAGFSISIFIIRCYWVD